jgi:hypothetical protein
MGLQLAIELFVVRNYAIAVALITPLALLVANGGRPAPAIGAEVLGRGVDTLIGCTIGLAVLLATTTSRGDGRLKAAFARVLVAARAVVTMLGRDAVTTLAARKARSELRNGAVDLLQLHEEQAAGSAAARREADRAWPAVVATERLAFRLLAACWERETRGADGGGAPVLGPAQADEVVEALKRLQSGAVVQVPALAGEFLAPELAALSESLPVVVWGSAEAPGCS